MDGGVWEENAGGWENDVSRAGFPEEQELRFVWLDR